MPCYFFLFDAKVKEVFGFTNCVTLPTQDKAEVKCYKFAVTIKTILVKVCLISKHAFKKDEPK